MIIFLDPKKVFKLLAFMIVCLIFLHVLGQLYFFFLHERLWAIGFWFNLDLERNVPTFFSSSILLICSAILTTIAGHARKNDMPYFRHWAALAGILLFLSLDEVTQIHERLGIRLEAALDLSGLLAFGWVIPYGLALIFLSLAYLRFIIHLSTRSRRLFLAAGTTYVAGALGIEMLSARHFTLHGDDIVYYLIYVTLEEAFEMLGISIFIYALLSYLVSVCKEIKIICPNN